jgi:hypothetical protein
MSLTKDELKFLLEFLRQHEWEYQGWYENCSRCEYCGETVSTRFDHAKGEYVTFGGIHKDDCKLQAIIRKLESQLSG